MKTALRKQMLPVGSTVFLLDHGPQMRAEILRILDLEVSPLR